MISKRTFKRRDMIFTVEGKPQGKARARTFYNKQIGKMQSITPEQTKSYEDLIRWSYISQGGKFYGEKALCIEIVAFYSIPKAFSKVKRNKAISGDIRPTTKPDGDNIIKVVLDALNGVAYTDDKAVVSVCCSKYYSTSPRVQVKIEKI